jgi:NitT/TauT family transport system ATP-binding protein
MALDTAAKEHCVRPLLSIDKVTLQYKTQHAVVTATYKVSCDVFSSERYVVLGPSGCGKSTLLKAVAGFIRPTQGSISLDGRPIAGPGPDRMMVFQEFDQLFAWKSVLANVMFPMVVSGKCGHEEARSRANRYIDLVGLAEFRNAHPHTLSGGMKQRVAIARAMAMEPAMLLMDEPFAALDALTRRKMQEELLELWSATRFTMLFVTHSIEEAIILGSRILVLSPHPGRVKAELNAQSLSHNDRDTAAFAELSGRIHRMLFADQVEAPHANYGAAHG